MFESGPSYLQWKEYCVPILDGPLYLLELLKRISAIGSKSVVFKQPSSSPSSRSRASLGVSPSSTFPPGKHQVLSPLNQG